MLRKTNIKQKKNHDKPRIFISWSGKNIGEKVAVLFSDFIKKINSEFNVITSKDFVSSGSEIYSAIIDNLKATDTIIILLDEYNRDSTWQAFETGIVRGKQSKSKRIIPLLLNGIEIESLPNYYYDLYVVNFTENELLKLFKDLCNDYYEENSIKENEIIKKFKEEWQELLRKVNDVYSIKNAVEQNFLKEYFLSKSKINKNNSNNEYGFISTIPEIKFHQFRRDIIEYETETLTIVGSSLYEAFSSSTQTPNIKTIDDLLVKKITNKDSKLKNLRIFISEPKLFDEPYNYRSKFDKNERPPKRINDTLENLIVTFNKDLKKDLTIEIYFIPLFQLDHVVLTDEFVLCRSTMLWVPQNNEDNKLIKGPYFAGYKTDADYCLYTSYDRYLKKLSSNCTEIDLSIKYDNSIAIKTNSQATNIHFTFRNDLKELNKENIKLYKLYESQLKSSLRSSWLKKFRNVFREEGYANETEVFEKNGENFDIKLYKNQPLIKENKTQKILLPYLQETENLLNQVVHKYDKEGFAQIIPSFDLGMPNNIQRLGGGFATGSVILWNCGTPIIPIDATVNVCSSSIYEINCDISSKLTSNFFKELLLKANQEGFVYNFESSNHFIIFGKNEKNNKYYLVLHSSAKEFKYNTIGLYPHKNSWYSNNIKTIYNNSKDRYLRYIKDDDAIQFYKIVKGINNHNIDVHNWYADIIASCTSSLILTRNTNHHYGMPTCYSINIGTFLLNQDQLVPIFSDRGKKIAVVKPLEKNIKMLINGEQKYIVPHGWGQDLKNDNFDSIELNLSNDKKEIKFGSKVEEIIEKKSIKDYVKVRSFESQSNFKESLNEKYSNYNIEFEITPIIAIDSTGYYSKK